MNHKLLSLLLAVIAAAALLTGCKDGQSGAATPDEAATADSAQAVTATAAAETTLAAESTQADPETTQAPATQATQTATQAATTQPATVQANVPKDNITGENLNPNMGAIQGQVAAEIDALTVQSIGLSENFLTINVGDVHELALTFTPENAAVKACDLTVSSGCAEAVFEGREKIKVTGKSAGTCTIIVTSKNGHKAYCDVTVKRVEQEITDDTELEHADLCTPINADRWRAAMAKHCAELGMKENTALQGSGNSVSTADDKTPRSYNSAERDYVQQAEIWAQTATNGEFESYEFNVVSKPEDGEFVFTLIINKIEEQ